MGVPRQAKASLFRARKVGQPPCVEALQPEEQSSSHYELLDVPSTASTAEIQAAYKRRALATHPDKGGVVGEFQRVLDAFQTLSDAARRHLYDQDVQQSIRRASTRLATEIPRDASNCSTGNLRTCCSE